jgi:hypothetical protein
MMRLGIAQLLVGTKTSEVGLARSESARAETEEFKKDRIARKLINRVIRMMRSQTVVEILARRKVQEMQVVVNVIRNVVTEDHPPAIPAITEGAVIAIVKIVIVASEEGAIGVTTNRPSQEVGADRDIHRILGIK